MNKDLLNLLDACYSVNLYKAKESGIYYAEVYKQKTHFMSFGNKTFNGLIKDVLGWINT